MANTKASLETAFAYVQEKKLNDLKPNSSIVYDMAPMKESDMVGRKYLAPVCLSYELGFTFGDGSAFTYEDDVAGVYDEIEIDPNPVVLKSRLSIEAADRMARGGEKSVLTHVALRAGQMKTSILKVAELEMLHGRTGLGTISANPVVTDVGADPTDTAVIIFTDATWAPGIWAGMVGAKLEARSGATKINTTSDLIITAVNYDDKSITVSSNNADLTALDAAHVIYLKGAYANGQYGIKYQLTTSGTVFGIDNTVHSLWDAPTHPVGGALTMSQVLKGIAKARSRGGLDEECVLLISDLTYEDLNADLSALKSTDSSYKPAKGENGVKGIVYHTQSVSVTIVAHPCMMEGEAFLVPKKGLKRIGSTDVTFARADGKEGAWEALESIHAYQLTCRYSFQVLISQPAKCVYFSGIVNS